ncbi:MAG: hypothetical protein ACYTG7_16685 [Planctomycetota bacterium]|jgi:hypothetical protein
MNKVIAAGVCLLWCTSLLHADLPLLENKGLLKDGGGILTVQMQAIPTIADWNEDGKKDLIVGQYASGNIIVYLNTGTDVHPEFNGSFKVDSSGVPISVTYG